MAKVRSYIVSSRPRMATGSNEVASTIAPPTKWRAPEDELPSETRGRKLYKRGGTMATRVIYSRKSIDISI